MYEGDSPEVGLAVWVEQNEERVPLPDGNYPSDLGVLVVADGVITEIQAEAPAEEEELNKETPSQVPSSAPSPEDAVQAIKSLLIKYGEDNDKRFKSLEDSLVEFKKENETLKEEVVTLSNQPAAKSIKTEVVQVELTSKGRLLEKIRKNQN